MMDTLVPTLVIYLLFGLGVAVALYLSDRRRPTFERRFSVALAVPFWPLFLPALLARQQDGEIQPLRPTPSGQADEMATAIAQVDAELEAALGSLDGWAEDVLARERGRIRELRAAWTAQAARIRDMDRLLNLPEYNLSELEPAPETGPMAERLRNCQHARRQNIDRLRQVRRRAYDDLMGTLAWVRELVSMIHLAKFTGAPASRAEELVAQIAAAVEGLSEVTWPDAATVPVGDRT
jgi:hypothetical protein